MGRLLQPVDDGFTSHAINRGKMNRDVVFEDDADFEAVLGALAQIQL